MKEQDARSDQSGEATADPRADQPAVPKITSVMIAASVLECEALLAMSRAKFLQGDLAGFLVSVVEARCKLETLHETIAPKATAEYFVAGGNQAATQSSGDDHGSEAQKEHSQSVASRSKGKP